jgi:hypothetical protein
VLFLREMPLRTTWEMPGEDQADPHLGAAEAGVAAIEPT